MVKNSNRHKLSGFTLIEAVVSMFTLLMCALIFAGTIPIANKSRGKAQNANIALSLAKKQIETLKHLGYSNMVPSQLKAAGLIDSTTALNLTATMLHPGATGLNSYEFTNADAGLVDHAGGLLPGGRSFVRITDPTLDVRQVEVYVFWQELGTPRFIKLGTRLANL
jgi:type II secretory pathway pseudopilin PulG